MKYIRTNGGIYEIVDFDDKCIIPCPIIRMNGRLTHCSDYKELSQADTIEELCDECISVLENGKGSHIWHESEFEEKTPYLFHNARMFKEDDEIIYGAIWTDKGLIYVAKMNEKGELELLKEVLQ